MNLEFNVMHLLVLATAISLTQFVIRWIAGLLVANGGAASSLGKAFGAIYA